MKKIVLPLALALSFLVGPLTALAVTHERDNGEGQGSVRPVNVRPIAKEKDATTTKEETRTIRRILRGEATSTREEIERKIEERKAEIQKKREELKQRLDEQRKQRIAAFFERVMKRLDAALKRMERLVERIDSRLTKLEEQLGIDATKARDRLDIARSKISDSQIVIGQAQDTIDELLESDNPKELFPGVRGLIRDIIGTIKEAHRALVDTLIEVKASKKLRTSDSTSTETEDGDDEEEDDDDEEEEEVLLN